MKQNLHHADNQPDWERIDPATHNTWQQIAAETNGFVTPGNALSVLGHATSIGSIVLGRTPEARGLGFFAGRLFDVIDGKVADATGTKSQVGAAFDAIGDKLTLGVAAIAGLARREISPLQGGTILAGNGMQAACNITVGLLDGTPKPNLAGKWSAALQSVAIGASVAAEGMRRYPALARTIETTGTVAWAGSCILGGMAIVGYAGDVTKTVRQKIQQQPQQQ